MAPTFTPVPDDGKKKRAKRQKEPTVRSLEATLWAAADKLRGHMDAEAKRIGFPQQALQP